MVKRANINKRSPMNISIASRLLGVSITIFILMLTFKSELLVRRAIVYQLILSIPLLLGSMISNAKIVDLDSFKDYYLFNRITNSIAISFVLNTIGLLVVHYVSKTIGLAFFALVLVVFCCLMYLDFNKRKMYNEVIMILTVFFLGFLQAILGQ